LVILNMMENTYPSRALVHSAEDLGLLVERTRKSRGYSQQAFADLAGVGRRFVSEVENGKPTAEIGKVLRVLTALGIDMELKVR
jgi:HTH-type transcriptional regulator / antitoxin HipB